jgi:myosin heavy subunit
MIQAFRQFACGRSEPAAASVVISGDSGAGKTVE